MRARERDAHTLFYIHKSAMCDTDKIITDTLPSIHTATVYKYLCYDVRFTHTLTVSVQWLTINYP